MAVFIDQMGNVIVLNGTPKRVISLVPSQTELLFDLGLDEEVYGITKYCIRPKHWQETKTKVGGTKKISIEKIKELRPDLIIGNKEENEKKQIEELNKHYPVWMSDIKTLENALDMIKSIGEILKKENASLKIQNDIREQFAHFKLSRLMATCTIKQSMAGWSKSTQKTSPPLSTLPLRRSGYPKEQGLGRKVLYLIWKKPYVCAGKDTFINHLLELCGFKNIITKCRYPQISPEEIQKINPLLIFLSSEPYPFREKHVIELQNLCHSSKVILVDGEMFSWYGSRLLYAPSYFERLLQNL